MKLTLILFTVLGVLAVGCQNDKSNPSNNLLDGNSAFNLEEVSGLIKDKTDRFTEAHLTKDTVFLNSCFTSDARVFPPNSDIVSGIAAISQLNSDWVNYGIYQFEETSTSFFGNKDYLIDEGTYHLIYGKERTAESGKYVTIWKNDGGIWKIYSNIWNSSLSLASSE
jgi:ketosteroid isomerase-like protein